MTQQPEEEITIEQLDAMLKMGEKELKRIKKQCDNLPVNSKEHRARLTRKIRGAEERLPEVRKAIKEATEAMLRDRTTVRGTDADD